MNQPVLLHLTRGTSIFFWNNAVYTAPPNEADLPSPLKDSDAFIWSLLAFKDNDEPPRFATFPRRCFPVQATSPFKKLRPVFSAFPSWTRDELVIAARLDPGFHAFWAYLNDYRHAISLLRKATPERVPRTTDGAFEILFDAIISRFGPIPRDVILGLYDFYSLTELHDEALSIRFEELTKIVGGTAGERQFPNTTTSDLVVFIGPVDEVGKHQSWTVNSRSAHVGKQLSERFVDDCEDDVRWLIDRLISVPMRKGVAGSLFKPLVHRSIARPTVGAIGGAWTLQKMSLQEGEHSGSIKFVYDASAEETHGSSKTPRNVVKFPSDELPDQLANDGYYIPSGLDYPLINSFVVYLDFAAGSADLWVLKITLEEVDFGEGLCGHTQDRRKDWRGFEKHKSESLLRKKLKGKQGSEPSVRVHYVLVCPERMVKPGLEWELAKGLAIDLKKEMVTF